MDTAGVPGPGTPGVAACAGLGTSGLEPADLEQAGAFCRRMLHAPLEAEPAGVTDTITLPGKVERIGPLTIAGGVPRAEPSATAADPP